jgi:hypothetical protein
MFFTVCHTARVSAATKTWSGASNGNWNVAANWTNNAVPVSGDDLVFPANIVATNSTNNIGGLALNSITFNGTNYVLRGNLLHVIYLAIFTAWMNALTFW